MKKWGNSIGIVIPNRAIIEKNLKEGEEVIIDIKKKDKIKEIFGSLKDWKIDSQKMKEELRKEWGK
ncbi:AbrB/MazE/SpoVT family DNA-binding domain-containing protein [Candidatus Pacearchaeota archaeon]|nr:AbrB/MazE/SpoVT family DNA-binding domain-containing protein [Candidatus Pacearchaeota archaeon]